MQLNLICFGRLKRGSFRDEVDCYIERIGRYTQFSLHEIKGLSLDSQNRPFLKASEMQRVLRLLSVGFNIFLSDRGRCLTSTDFAQFIEGLFIKNHKRVNFVIGGPYGLPDALLDRADTLLSLSSMTFPYEIVRLLLLEQIYRAFTILKGEPYSH